MVSKKLKGYKLLNTYQILSKLNKAGRKTVRSEIYKFTGSIQNKDGLLLQW